MFLTEFTSTYSLNAQRGWHTSEFQSHVFKCLRTDSNTEAYKHIMTKINFFVVDGLANVNFDKKAQLFGRKLLSSSGEVTMFLYLHTVKGNKICFTCFSTPKSEYEHYYRYENQDCYIVYYNDICLPTPKKTYHCSNSRLVIQRSSYAIFLGISLRK